MEPSLQAQAQQISTATSAAAARGLPARRPGDDGGPAANPVHHLPSGRVNQPRAAGQRAPPSAAACIAGRETEGPLYGAAAPGGGGRAGLEAIVHRARPTPPRASRNPRALTRPPIGKPAPRDKADRNCAQELAHRCQHTPHTPPGVGEQQESAHSRPSARTVQEMRP